MSLENRKRQYKIFMERGETALAEEQLHSKLNIKEEKPEEKPKSKEKK